MTDVSKLNDTKEDVTLLSDWCLRRVRRHPSKGISRVAVSYVLFIGSYCGTLVESFLRDCYQKALALRTSF